ncbi:hypothetical protein TRICI_002770 [Trichomonascus ciferrii]|uniref:F-box domain-containing protein n=1 Tax=Trichomonascus ciferrii TaxID=44093 RepID=A0A642VAW8_9ASCO|nr:hypothetical protein TRICI_002770 [Trichomonascus ciferrii]
MSLITDIPDELIIFVLEYLDEGKAILNMGQVKRKYYGPSTDDKVWKRHCEDMYRIMWLEEEEKASRNYIDDYRKQLHYDRTVQTLLKRGVSCDKVERYNSIIKIGLLGARARMELNRVDEDCKGLATDCLKTIMHLRSLDKLLRSVEPLDFLKGLDGFYWDTQPEFYAESKCKELAEGFKKDCEKGLSLLNVVRKFSKFLTTQGVLQARTTRPNQHIGELEIKGSGLGARHFLSGVFSKDSKSHCNAIINAFIYTMTFRELYPSTKMQVMLGLNGQEEREQVYVQFELEEQLLLVSINTEGAITQPGNKALRPLTMQDVLNKVITPAIDQIGDSMFTPHNAIPGRSLGLRISKELLAESDLKNLQIPIDFIKNSPWELDLINHKFPDLSINPKLISDSKLHYIS